MSKRTRLLSKLKHVYSHNAKLVLDVENRDIEYIIEGVEKQIAKKVKRLSSITSKIYKCPTCGFYPLKNTCNYQCCNNCGQKIDWSETDE